MDRCRRQRRLQDENFFNLPIQLPLLASLNGKGPNSLVPLRDCDKQTIINTFYLY